MAEIVKRDYLSYIDNLLPCDFQDHENLKELIKICIENNTELEDALQELSETTNINVATGYQLDLIGVSVGAFREGRNDAEYRDYIRLQRAINNSNGTSNDLLDLLKDISQSERTNIWEHPYNAATLATYGSENDYPNLVNDMDKLAPAGTRISAVIKYEDGNIIPASGTSKAGRFVSTGGVFEFGSDDTEFGSEAEFGPIPQVLYNRVEGLENCYLPTIKDYYDTYNTSAGEDFMQAGEPEAVAGDKIYKGDGQEGALSTAHVLSYQRDGN